MTLALKEPSTSASVVELADFFELGALRAADRTVSVHDLARDLNRAGTVEVLDADPRAENGMTDPDEDVTVIDRGGEIVEAVAEDGVAEIEARIAACDGAYPFDLDANGVLYLRRRGESSPYIFMLLLTRFGGKIKVPNHQDDGTKIFEELSRVAGAEYFGWVDHRLRAYPFGFPRRLSAKGFEDAVNDLCKEIKEGEGCRKRPNLERKKDAALDLVVARPFPDARPSQLIGFGQCATGDDWESKISDLDPEKFCKMWLKDVVAVNPVAMFFVPHTIDESQWLDITLSAGLLFDRCRMAYYTTPLHDRELHRSIGDWSTHVITSMVRR